MSGWGRNGPWGHGRCRLLQNSYLDHLALEPSSARPLQAHHPPCPGRCTAGTFDSDFVLPSFLVPRLAASGPAARPLAGVATAQRAAEPAWHRRRRRQRASARVVLRLAAAARLVQGHHSAQRQPPARTAMPGGRNGGGGGGGYGGDLQARFEQLERIVLGLQGGSAAAGNGGGGAGGRGQGGSGAQQRGGGSGARGAGNGSGAGSKGRPGDWTCPSCGAHPCFARTSRCFRCKAPRPVADRGGGAGGVARSASSETYLGPVGANGARPLLGRWGQGAASGSSPSFRVPGASVAAKAEAAHRQRQAPLQPPAAKRDGGNGDDGGRKAPRREGTPPRPAAGAAAACQGLPVARAPVSITNSWAALSEEPEELDEASAEYMEDVDEGDADDADGAHDDGHAEDGGDDDVEEGSAEDGGRGSTAGPSAEELKQVWLANCSSCRMLERDDGTQPGLLAAARAQRDAAEKAWRQAKRPHPLHKRLRWAEGELRDAEAKEASRRRELDAHIAQAAKRKEELEARLEVDVARTRRKRAHLEALHGECAWPPRQAGAEQAARAAVTGIQEVAPTLASIIESMGDDAAGVRQELQLVSAALGNVESILQEAAEGDAARRQQQQQQQQQLGQQHGPSCYDISDGATRKANGQGGGGGGGPHGGGAGGVGPGAPTPTPTTAATPRWTRANGQGQWKRQGMSAAEAVEAARRLLRRQGEAAATPKSADDSGGSGGASAGAEGAGSSACTNDLAEAERRARAESERQMQQALQQQQQQQTLEQRQLEELQRQQRELRQQEEQRRHEAAMQQAAAARAAEEAKQRDEAFEKLSPEERERVKALHAQHALVGAQAFGTQEASLLAGLVHQTHVHNVVQAAAEADGEQRIEYLMSLTPEEFAEYEQQQYGRGEMP